VIALASVAVDLHITQMVNDIPGVHALLPHGRVR
jgi:acetamidase/formamidase